MRQRAVGGVGQRAAVACGDVAVHKQLGRLVCRATVARRRVKTVAGAPIQLRVVRPQRYLRERRLTSAQRRAAAAAAEAKRGRCRRAFPRALEPPDDEHSDDEQENAERRQRHDEPNRRSSRCDGAHEDRPSFERVADQ